MQSMVHKKNAQYIELCVFRGLVVKKIITAEKEFFEVRVIIALDSGEHEG